MPATNFKFSDQGCTNIDFDDVFVRREVFLEGGLWVWGSNQCGKLGIDISSAAGRSSPVQTVSGGTNWKQVSTGYYTTGAIKTDGTLWLWGRTYRGGTLGDNSTVNKSSPVQTVSSGTNWKQVSVGGYHAGAIKTDGTLWMWGRNCCGGSVGDNSSINKSSPVQTVSSGTNWKQLSVSHYNSAAIKTDGTLWVWGQAGDFGFGGAGALGDNSTITRSSPVQTVSSGTNWKQVSVGSFHMGAIKTDGTLWMWGANADGRLGTNDTIDRSSPVQTVSSGTNWKQISTGLKRFCANVAATKTDGTLWLWGTNYRGILGDNSTIARSSPVQTVSSGTNWKQVSAGGHQTGAIKTDGTLWMWGGGSLSAFASIGDNTTIPKSSPVQTVSSGTNWRQVSAGIGGSAAIREECW